MNEPVELRTKRLLLRRFQTGDVADALAYRDDEEFARYLPHIPQPFTREDAEAFVERNMREPWELFPTFAVVCEGRVIGTVNFDVEPPQAIAMVGFAIGRAHWGHGIAPEAAAAAIAWAFEAFSLAKIWASTDIRNLRSQRVMEKLGMRREGLLRSHEVARDGRTDKVICGLLRSEWLSVHQPADPGRSSQSSPGL